MIGKREIIKAFDNFVNEFEESGTRGLRVVVLINPDHEMVPDVGNMFSLKCTLPGLEISQPMTHPAKAAAGDD